MKPRLCIFSQQQQKKKHLSSVSPVAVVSHPYLFACDTRARHRIRLRHLIRTRARSFIIRDLLAETLSHIYIYIPIK